jgi:hypothetical protein
MDKNYIKPFAKKNIGNLGINNDTGEICAKRERERNTK